MRTFGLSLGAAAIAATLATPSLAAAQRNSRRSSGRLVTPSAASSSMQPCSGSCGDYSLAVVSALLPAKEAASASSTAMVTLVIENRGAAPAPASFISVAPRNRLAAARHSTIPPLAPGERFTVQLPVENGPEGTRCVSITISPAPVQDPATAQFLASSAANPPASAPASASASASALAPTIPPGSAADLAIPRVIRGWSLSSDLPFWPDPPVAPFRGEAGDHGLETDLLQFDSLGTA